MFITFEGIEGCGKSTQAKLLAEKLREKGYDVLLTREPGGTESGERIRELLLERREGEIFPPTAELFLYLAARAFHVENAIAPALRSGKIVICDRFSDSTLAYQGYGRGLPVSLIKEADMAARAGLEPDITFLLELPVEVAFERIRGRRKDRMELEDISFHERVRRGFLEIAKENQRVVILDAAKSALEIHEEILKILREKMKIAL